MNKKLGALWVISWSDRSGDSSSSMSDTRSQNSDWSIKAMESTKQRHFIKEGAVLSLQSTAHYARRPSLQHLVQASSFIRAYPAMLFFSWLDYMLLGVEGLFMPKLRNLVMLPEIVHLLILHEMIRVWLFLSAYFCTENNPMALACSLYLCTYTIVLY